MLTKEEEFSISNARDLESIRLVMNLFHVVNFTGLDQEKINELLTLKKYPHLGLKPEICELILKSEVIMQEYYKSNRSLLDVKETNILHLMGRVDKLLASTYGDQLSSDTHIASGMVSQILENLYETQLSYIYDQTIREELLEQILSVWDQAGIDSKTLIDYLMNETRKNAISETSCFIGRSDNFEFDMHSY